MVLMIAGILLWSFAHWFKRLAPDARARLGQPGMGLIALLLLASLAMMIFGYRWAAFIPVWSPPAFLTHVNNLLMLIAFYIYMSTAALPGKVWIASKIRHPQLIGFKTWAIAHLLVNGDVASILLFGGLLAWAVVSVILINKGGDTFDRSKAPIKSEPVFAAVALAAFAAVAFIHSLLLWPFPG